MSSHVSKLISIALREAIQTEVTRSLSAVQIPPPLTLSKWADQHFYLSAESSAVQGRWESLPWQVDIMDCISNDDIREIDWLKSARVGYTKILMAAAAYYLTHKGRSGAIYQPTDSDAAEFSKSEVDPMIRDVEECRRAFNGNPEKRGRSNTIELKQFLAALLYIRGGHSARSYRRLTIDWVFYDELEGFERDVDNEGDPVSLGDARITNSAFPKSVRGSTPRLQIDSLINGEAERASHFFRYYIPCPECDTAQHLQFAQLRWQKDRPETVRYECAHCEAPWEYRDLYPLLESGFWSTEDGYRINQGVLNNPDGEPVDWPRHIAFHIWAAYSPFISWRELVEEWLEAVHASRQGDIRKLKTFTNTRLAEPWEEAGEQVAFDQLYARREPYTRPPKEALLLTAAFDVQDNRLEGEIVAHARGGETWGIEYRTIYGDPEMIEVWDELDNVIGQVFETEDGRKLPIAAVAIDTGFLPDHAYAFWRRTRHPRVFCLKGAGGEDKPIVASPVQRKSGKSKAPVPLFMMGADVCKSIVYKRLTVKEPGPGYQHFPESYDEEYFRGLTAEKKIKKKRKGFTVIEWIKDRPRNEPLDIRAMTTSLIEIINPVWDALDPDNAPKPEVEQPQQPYIPHAHRRRNWRRR